MNSRAFKVSPISYWRLNIIMIIDIFLDFTFYFWMIDDWNETREIIKVKCTIYITCQLSNATALYTVTLNHILLYTYKTHNHKILLLSILLTCRCISDYFGRYSYQEDEAKWLIWQQRFTQGQILDIISYYSKFHLQNLHFITLRMHRLPKDFYNT